MSIPIQVRTEKDSSNMERIYRTNCQLKWVKPQQHLPFWDEGQSIFFKHRCKINDCYLTSNRNMLRSVADFDAIVFHGSSLIFQYTQTPNARSPRQKYVFLSVEHTTYPICDDRFDGFFNWTWTYQFDSDYAYGYLRIRNEEGKVIGPNKTMHWMDAISMKTIDDELKRKLNNKAKAAACIVSDCQNLDRETFVKKLQFELKQYELEVDIYRRCDGGMNCDLKNMSCLQMIEKKYYFYLALKNPSSENIVTEKLLLALQNYAVPIVLGVANYTRFFKWHNHYSYHAREESPDTDGLCKLCEMLHDEELMSKKTVYKDFRKWWNWTNPKNVPFVYMGVGQQVFIDRKCKYTNCFVTDDRDYLGDVTKFDAIAFAGTDVIYMSRYDLPKKRSPHQKYAFTNIESADNYPVCTNRFNNFFNWTWTYRLDSETKWGYLIVRDAKNNIIGPKTEMHWMKLEDMDPIDDALRVKLRNKTKAAAWFVSNCRSRSGRETYFRNLIKALKPYNLTVDIYGKCGPLKCDRNKEAECNDMVERDYYFYLSFENSFAEDYATEKLAHGLQHNAIPIVYGGANYTRFMPDGIYLNARQLGPEALAKQMKHLIDNPDEYDNYFRWKKYYSYHRKYESPETDDYCGFCMLLNNEEMVKKTSIYKNFSQWWDPPNRCSDLYNLPSNQKLSHTMSEVELVQCPHFPALNFLKGLHIHLGKVHKTTNSQSNPIWTNSKHEPFMYMGVGQQGFIDRKCKYTNCFVTDDRDYLGDVTKFDVIAFAGPEVVHMNETKLPKKRSPHQKYAFTNIESADNYPACTNRFDNFFNWTWTYRLDSETKWGYLIVRDAENNIIGPNTEMHWMKIKDMDPIDDALRVKLRNKTKAAAWFVSNCRSRSGRENFVKHLQKALKSYDLTVDIYGKCGPLKCGRDKAAECNDMVERDYYFYLSFENSFAKDYVTEKLLYGLQHNAVPIVYGGANYTSSLTFVDVA
ncbi:hypothetical protein MSG28_004250 [Choristoneura fumiferana]|uniref:Uncharacterized protein n=1 Tax=Choristoneura fumiferana TaxID=7141 RepID=A0ACC0KI36_CHOFU|nr:hypothetical protein MSG28_004250 [Choristoneura fumiferana]